MQEMLKITGIRKSFSTLDVLKGVDLTVHKGEVVSLIGPSGSGKTTLLRCANFLDQAEDGTMVLDGQTYHLGHVRRTEMYEARRHTAFVFQNYNLFLNKTALQNVTEGLIVARKMPRDEAEARAQKALEKVGLSNRGASYPNQLSGGQQQRVGVARALAANPQVLLMDEPFGALDPVTRGALQAEMTRIHRILGRTIVLVTHDIDEALRLADHLVLMDHGEVVQQGSPLELLTWPKNDFVREFFGRSELGVRLLSLRTVSDYMRREAAPVSGEPLQAQMSLRDALSAFVARQCEVLPVSDARGAPCGTLHFRDLLAGEVTREGTA